MESGETNGVYYVDVNGIDDDGEHDGVNLIQNDEIVDKKISSSPDEDTPIPRNPSLGRTSSKSRDTLTPLESPRAGQDMENADATENADAVENSTNIENTTEATINGETLDEISSLSNKSTRRDTLEKSKSMSCSDEMEGRRTSFGNTRSATVTGSLPMTLPSQRRSENGDAVENSTNVENSTEATVNGETSDEMSSLSNESTKRDALEKSKSISHSDKAEDRRTSFGNTRSATVAGSLPRTLPSQRRSVDRPERSPPSTIDRDRPSKPTLSRSGSTSQDLMATWESRAQGEPGKPYSQAKALGGQTGTSTLKDRFEKNQASQPSKYRRQVSIASGSIGDIDGDTVKKVSASALRARFEQKADTEPPKRNFVINKGKTGAYAKKFNTAPSNSTKCQVCTKSVYPMEKLEVDGLVFHKSCLKCETCKRTLSLGTYAALQGKYYCKPHLKQLFKLKGNYDEGFGREQRKANWIQKDPNETKTLAPEKQEAEPSPGPEVNGDTDKADDVPVDNGEVEE